MKITTATFALFGAITLTVPAFADEAKPADKPVKKISVDQVYEKLGGRLEKPGTCKGSTGFINVRSAVEKDEIDRVVATIGRILPYRQKVVALEKLEGLPTRAMVKRAGLDVGVFVVSDANLPPMLVAPEERWALVNVAKLKAGLKDDAAGKALYRARCRGELQRAFCYVAGGGSSQYDNNLMCVSEVAQLDTVNPDQTVFDTISRCRKYLESIGVTFPILLSYQKACQEGWAPAPTNDVQKAIWDKVHAMPTEPIKIKPETKKVRE